MYQSIFASTKSSISCWARSSWVFPQFVVAYPATSLPAFPAYLRFTMNTDLTRKKTPEELELENKERELAGLEEMTSERELELATIQAELQRFELKYLTEIGVLVTELDGLNATIAEKSAAAKPDDPVAQAEAAEAREQADESYKATESVVPEETAPEPFEPTADLKKLFRTAARKYHPDTTTDPDEREARKKIMAEVNRLYEAGDEDGLRRFLETAGDRPEAIQGEGVAFDIVRAIRKAAQLRERLAEIESLLEAVREDQWYLLREEVRIAAEEGRDLFAEMAESLKIEIAQAESQLASLGE